MEPSAELANSRRLSRRGRYGALGAGAVSTGALTYVALVDPHRSDTLFPLCPFKMLTGWNCPACGGLRMMHDLLHGNVSAAVVDNVFLLVGIPALIAWILYRRRTGQPAASRTLFVVVVVAAIAWTVTRNLPGFPLVPTIYDG